MTPIPYPIIEQAEAAFRARKETRPAIAVRTAIAQRDNVTGR